ncbi:hypothetical protein ACQ0QQ_14545 [Lysinibacillus sphaericus]
MNIEKEASILEASFFVYLAKILLLKIVFMELYVNILKRICSINGSVLLVSEDSGGGKYV